MAETRQRATHPDRFPSRSRRALARHDDPPASQEAAARALKSGRLQRELDAALLAVARYPHLSTRALHERTGLSTHLLGRRLPDLLARKLVSRRPNSKPWRWFATTPGIERARTLPAGAIAECRERTPREQRLEAAMREAHVMLNGAGIPSDYPAPEHPSGRRPYRLVSRIRMLMERVGRPPA